MYFTFCHAIVQRCHRPSHQTAQTNSDLSPRTTSGCTLSASRPQRLQHLIFSGLKVEHADSDEAIEVKEATISTKTPTTGHGEKICAIQGFLLTFFPRQAWQSSHATHKLKVSKVSAYYPGELREQSQLCCKMRADKI